MPTLTPLRRLTLDEFLQLAATDLGAFALAFRVAQGEGSDTRREGTTAEWFGEVCAYFELAELQEGLSHERRSPVERRRLPRHSNP